jgi:hypothetical protein
MSHQTKCKSQGCLSKKKRKLELLVEFDQMIRQPRIFSSFQGSSRESMRDAAAAGQEREKRAATDPTQESSVSNVQQQQQQQRRQRQASLDEKQLEQQGQQQQQQQVDPEDVNRLKRALTTEIKSGKALSEKLAEISFQAQRERRAAAERMEWLQRVLERERREREELEAKQRELLQSAAAARVSASPSAAPPQVTPIRTRAYASEVSETMTPRSQVVEVVVASDSVVTPRSQLTLVQVQAVPAERAKLANKPIASIDEDKSVKSDAAEYQTIGLGDDLDDDSDGDEQTRSQQRTPKTPRSPRSPGPDPDGGRKSLLI